jgi:hypothetical protein
VKPKYSPRNGRTWVSSDGCTRGLLSRGPGHRADEIDRSLQNVRTQTESGAAGPGNQSRLNAKPHGGRNRADSLPAGLPALYTELHGPHLERQVSRAGGKMPGRRRRLESAVTAAVDEVCPAEGVSAGGRYRVGQRCRLSWLAAYVRLQARRQAWDQAGDPRRGRRGAGGEFDVDHGFRLRYARASPERDAEGIIVPSEVNPLRRDPGPRARRARLTTMRATSRAAALTLFACLCPDFATLTGTSRQLPGTQGHSRGGDGRPRSCPGTAHQSSESPRQIRKLRWCAQQDSNLRPSDS